ncbi:hypothetical protein BTR23_23410 [Alkalihalophilus pseudofirmus]|nr:hypothetical protein BTR23_23410 [Alkalihalophilus pseudofirmus]
MEDPVKPGSSDTDPWDEKNKNIILYGPPGTGKTYNSVKYAVAIIEKTNIEEIDLEIREYGYEHIKERYDQYKQKGLIEFTTFHQSYGYEEFIEGIRPVIQEEAEGEIQYSIEPGIFKNFCDAASNYKVVSIGDETLEFDHPTIWKISLEGAGENETKRECFENGHIRIGWDHLDEYIEYDTHCDTDGIRSILLDFQNEMEIGDIVLSLRTQDSIDAIGFVTGEYEFDDSYENYKRKRDVKWIATNINENILALNGNKKLTLRTVYRLNRISLNDLLPIIDNYREEVTEEQEENNYVFIIDEINRGNISKIFGELITLIEKQKRLGMKEQVKVTLPYSKKTFGVPSNVFILGTMNTADRSIALLDTALRRRFSFIEMLPDISVLQNVVVEGIEVDRLLQIINQRIEVLYDREHTIGHAYFTELKDKPTLHQLAAIFKNSVIPLLQEYFYEDYKKIQLILGDTTKENQYKFIVERKVDASLFGQTEDIDIDLEETYQINTAAFFKIDAYKKVYGT